MRRTWVASIGSVLLVTLAGCGGGSGEHAYTLAATRACLEHAGYQARTLSNPSLPGAGGNRLVRLRKVEPLLTPAAPGGTLVPNVFVFLVFAKDAASARATENKAIRLALQTFSSEGEAVTRAYVQAGIGLVRNVFYYSPSGAVTHQERAGLSVCLH